MSETKDPPQHSLVTAVKIFSEVRRHSAVEMRVGEVWFYIFADDSDDNDDEHNTPVFVIDSKPRIEPETEEAPCTTRERVKLASELNPGIILDDTYVASHDAASKSAQKLLKGSVLTPGFGKQDCVPPYSESPRRIKLRRKVGTVMDSPADFNHARVPKKDRKQTMVEELLADAEFRRFNKKKYSEAMAWQQQGVSKKAFKHMKRLKKRRK
ncbi:hypothetical protein MRX96_028200 [Rhipicephalus microplus]